MYAGLETHVRRLLRDETLLVTKYGGSTLNDELKLIAEIEDTIPPLQELTMALCNAQTRMMAEYQQHKLDAINHPTV